MAEKFPRTYEEFLQVNPYPAKPTTPSLPVAVSEDGMKIDHDTLVFISSKYSPFKIVGIREVTNV